MRIIYIGTLAPAIDGWWHDLIDTGSTHNTHVMALRGDVEKWDQASELRRCNPLMWHYPESRKVLLAERDAARSDTRLKSQFLSFRCNRPSGDENQMALTLSDWLAVEAREQGAREGRPIVGADLGGNRSWSAAVAWWPSGLVDAVAVAPGIPSLDDQERRDRAVPGSYRKLADLGLLRMAEGLRVVPPAQLWRMVLEQWGKPQFLIVDRFRLADLQDAVKNGARIEPRVTNWSEASADIRALRKYAKDGPMSVVPSAALLIAASLSVAQVKADTNGNFRMVKRSSNNASRDDVAMALTLAAGAFSRKPVRTGIRSLGHAG